MRLRRLTWLKGVSRIVASDRTLSATRVVELQPIPPTLCHTATCSVCGRDFVSATRGFPKVYVCWDCQDPVARAELQRSHEEWMAAHERCFRGHLLTEATVYRNKHGSHTCRLCRAEAQRKRTKKRT